SSTLRLQRMLYRALSVQILVIALLLYTPLVVGFVTLFMRLRRGSQYAQIALTLTTFHMTVDAVALLYFVRPYREYVHDLFTCGKASKRKNSVGVLFPEKIEVTWIG
ncbi:Protein STR-86, partial [Aphelenchoides avenae]